MVDRRNVRRAVAADRAVDAFLPMIGNTNEGHHATLIKLLQSLMHWADSWNTDFIDAVQHASDIYEADRVTQG